MHGLPSYLRNRTIEYLDAQWRVEHGERVERILDELPSYLQGEIKMSLHGAEVRMPTRS